jgi:glutathione S-transferase
VKLVFANKNYSSWSLRPWLVMKHTGIAFEEDKLSFNDPQFHARIARYSPAANVPVLVDGELAIWDTLAIVEYLAEKYPDKQLWPAERAARARARSLCAEMHSGFRAMRDRLAMNCELRLPLPLDNDTRRDVTRAIDIFNAATGPFLFGQFSIADAFFTPVVLRFQTYGVELTGTARAWADTILALPALQAWVAEGLAEHDFVQFDEPYRTQRG